MIAVAVVVELTVVLVVVGSGDCVGGDCVVETATTNAREAVGTERCQSTSREADRPGGVKA